MIEIDNGGINSQLLLTFELNESSPNTARGRNNFGVDCCFMNLEMKIAIWKCFLMKKKHVGERLCCFVILIPTLLACVCWCVSLCWQIKHSLGCCTASSERYSAPREFLMSCFLQGVIQATDYCCGWGDCMQCERANRENRLFTNILCRTRFWLCPDLFLWFFCGMWNEE